LALKSENIEKIMRGEVMTQKTSDTNFLVPSKVFFVTGVGKHSDPLVSFELALRDAGIEKFNLVQVSSILPPGCEKVTAENGISMLKPGQVVFTVMARHTSNEAGKKIFASIGVAKPFDSTKNGYIAEYAGEWKEEYQNYAGEMAGYMLETAFDIDDFEKFTILRIAEVEDYTTVVSAAVFVF
jgi:arginine decarboxylase